MTRRKRQNYELRARKVGNSYAFFVYDKQLNEEIGPYEHRGEAEIFIARAEEEEDIFNE